MNEGQASVDFNNTAAPIFTTVGGASSLQLDVGWIALITVIAIVLGVVIALLVFLFGNNVVGKCCKLLRREAQPPATDLEMEPLSDANVQLPPTDEPDASPVSDPPGADTGAVESASQAGTDASSGATQGGRPTPQAKAARSTHGTTIHEMEIKGTNCPFIGHSDKDDFHFRPTTQTGPNEANSAGRQAAESTTQQDEAHTVMQDSIGEGRAGVPSGAVSGGAEGGITIGKLTVDGQNNPVIGESKGSTYTFHSN